MSLLFSAACAEDFMVQGGSYGFCTQLQCVCVCVYALDVCLELMFTLSCNCVSAGIGWSLRQQAHGTAEKRRLDLGCQAVL